MRDEDVVEEAQCHVDAFATAVPYLSGDHGAHHWPEDHIPEKHLGVRGSIARQDDRVLQRNNILQSHAQTHVEQDLPAKEARN